MHHSLLFRSIFLLGALFSSVGPAMAEDTKSVQELVRSVSPWLVRIDTIGGHEKVGAEFANEGTSTGVLLDRTGFVLTSAFHFLHDPTSILLRFSDGSKKIARKVAVDRNRMLTLLKVEGLDENAFPDPPEFRSKDAVRIGRRCLVFGVALGQDEPNLAHGIVSGKNRIWGKAIQTDAAIGPNNYGGPMIDFDGRWIGLAVPLSMTSHELSAGSETYDAGVGMVVPFEDIFGTILPNLKLGKDLEPGTLGIGLHENQTFIGQAVLERVPPGLPAALAGLKAGDRILAIDDHPIGSALDLAMNLRPRYADETLRLTFLCDGKEETVSVTTVPYPKRKQEE